MRAWVLLACLPLALASFPFSSASESPQPTLHILHDVPDDGYTYVGNPVEFGYVMLTAEEKTTVHKQGLIRVVQNGVTLYETSADGDAAHDYDALNTFLIAFPTAGPYEVTASIPGSLALEASFKGYAHPIENATSARIEAKAPASAVVGVPTLFEYKVLDEAGGLIPHTDSFFEVRRAADHFLVFRTHTHSHDESQMVAYTFLAPGEYDVRLTGYVAFPEAGIPQFAPVAQTLKVRVADPDATGPAPILPSAAPLPEASGSGPYVLLTGLDPSRVSSPFSQFRLSTLVYDTEAKRFVPHVNFEAQIVDAAGRVLFRSDSLHEYDGDFDVVFNSPNVGPYTLQVAALKGEWVGRVDLAFIVGLAPTAPNAGPLIISADGLDGLTSGTAQKITFHARTLLGTAGEHSEIEFQLLPAADSAAILRNKLHTHESGDFEAHITFPTAGDYVLALDAEGIHGEPTPGYYWEDVGGSLFVPLEVAPGVALPDVPPPVDPTDAGLVAPEGELPGFEVLLALSVLTFAAARRRR